MRLFLSMLIVFCIPIQSNAQITQSPQSTVAPPNSRYEVVQSEIVARLTFRLDRECGNVAQLVRTQSGGYAWEEMLVLGLPNCNANGRARYQIFTSGLLARNTFLIDTQTGKSWQTFQEGDTLYWAPFEN